MFIRVKDCEDKIIYVNTDEITTIRDFAQDEGMSVFVMKQGTLVIKEDPFHVAQRINYNEWNKGVY